MRDTEKDALVKANATLDIPISLSVFYDASCAMCLSFVAHFSSCTSDTHVNWVAVTPTTQTERSELRFRIVDDQGREYFDTDARLLLLHSYPRYRLIARLLSSPLLRYVVDPMFDLIATNRYRIARLFTYFGMSAKSGEATACHSGRTCGEKSSPEK